MTDPKKHAARLREMSQNAQSLSSQWAQYSDDAKALLAGAEALEAQGQWRIRNLHTSTYLIPGDRSKDWADWLLEREVGEPSAIVPEWAVPVPDDVVITGWVR